MPSRKQRNARLSPNNSPVPYIFNDLPVLEHDLIDIHGTSTRVRGDPAPLVPVTPNVVPLEIAADPALPEMTYEAGHVRSPILAREPTMLENFSRTVRNYVPSSIPIPTAAPAPPHVSRPLSVGNFMPSALLSTSPASPAITKRRGSGGSGVGTHDWRARNAGPFGMDDVFGSDDDEIVVDGPPARGDTSYPGVADGDPILWSRWDQLLDERKLARRLLFLGYSIGLQIWDCTNLGAVSEILNLSKSLDWGRVMFAGVLHPPPPSELDPFALQRPLVGVVARNSDESSFLVYSLRTHKVIKSVAVPSGVVQSFSSSDRFIVICTTNPPSLHVLSSTSFTTLHIIPSASLVPFTHSPPLKPNTNNVSVSDIDTGDVTSQPRPIFSLSHRLLAFASSPPPLDSPANPSATHPRAQTRPPPSSAFGVSQADLGNAAMTVGGTVLSGIKSLGGMAYSAAKARVGPFDQGTVRPSSSASGLSHLFFSRSAPTASDHNTRRASFSTHGTGSSYPQVTGSSFESPIISVAPHGPSSPSKSSTGSHVMILDLEPLLASPSSHPTTLISQFMASKRQPISNVDFTSDGNSLIVSTEDGRVIRVFQIRPVPAALRDEAGARIGGLTPAAEPWHVYNLRRGRTSAVVERVNVSEDGRWIAVGTRNRTVHVFAVNPYGGKPDNRSHLEGRVQNVLELPLSTDVTPLVRLRVINVPLPEQTPAPVSFTFIKSSSLPTSLLPPQPIAISAPTSAHASPVHHAGPLTTLRIRRPPNYQDVLMFDPTDGSLSLRRFTLEMRPRDQAALSFPSNTGSTSISLPGVSPPSRLGVSPPGRPSALSQMMDIPTELVGRDSIVASWNLKRNQDWRDIRGTLQPVSHLHNSPRSPKPNSLAHAELSTSSRSNRILPRSIYLSHQFSFHALGEDYHALIRRFHLDIGGCKIEVRREVEVSAYSAGTGESFVEGFSAPLHVRRPSSSFDEPLASALSAGLDHSHPSRVVIPMLPNGIPGSRPKSFRNSVPIRNMATGFGDGVSEGLGRIRREIHKVRSPRLGPRYDVPGSVALEFDEEDEDFLYQGSRLGIQDDDSISRSTSRGEGDSGASVSTPSTSVVPLDDETDDLWHGWNTEDKLAVDEAEQFDDVVGFLDEEQTPKIHAERTERNRRRAV